MMNILPTLSPPDQLNFQLLAGKNEGMRRVLEEVLARQRGSIARHERSLEVLSGTHSMLAYEAPAFPLCVARAAGSHIWDVDGNEYIDCHMSYSASILGHNPPPVVAAVQEALPRGLQGGHFFEEQIELAERIRQMVPGVERVTYFHTGGEAIAAAVRLARAARARSRVAKFEGCYHGSNDVGLHNPWALLAGGIRPSPLDDIPPQVATSGIRNDESFLILPFNSPVALDLIRKNADDLAAVVMDPMPQFMSNWPDECVRFVKEVSACAREVEVPMIFDEVVCGFRLARGGARELTGERPAMSCYGKITSGLGIPLAPLAGDASFLDAMRTAGPMRDYFAGKVWVTSTLSANFLAVVAGLAVLRHLGERYDEVMGRIDSGYEQLRQRLDDFAQRSGIPVSLQGHPRLQPQLTVGKPTPSEKTYRGMMQTSSPLAMRTLAALTFYLRQQGIYTKIVPTMNLSAAHTDEDITRIAAGIEAAVTRMREDGMIAGSS
jgi:glutamate-1-semialdehyde 2,1-aminomutase